MWKFKNRMIKRSINNLSLQVPDFLFKTHAFDKTCEWSCFLMPWVHRHFLKHVLGPCFSRGHQKNTTPNQLSFHENHENRNEIANVPSPTNKTSNKAFWIETDGSRILGPYFWFRGMSWSRRVEHQTILKHRCFSPSKIQHRTRIWSWSGSKSCKTNDFTCGVTWLKILSVSKGFLSKFSGWNFPASHVSFFEGIPSLKLT